jgi:hypothetical protein
MMLWVLIGLVLIVVVLWAVVQAGVSRTTVEDSAEAILKRADTPVERASGRITRNAFNGSASRERRPVEESRASAKLPCYAPDRHEPVSNRP